MGRSQKGGQGEVGGMSEEDGKAKVSNGVKNTISHPFISHSEKGKISASAPTSRHISMECMPSDSSINSIQPPH